MTVVMSSQSLSDMTATAITDVTSNASPASPTLQLRFTSAGREGQVLQVVGEKFTLGSESGCTIRLRSPLIAPIHVWGVRGQLGTLLRAVSSDTRVNGLPFHEAWVQHGDRLSIGPIDFEIEVVNHSTRKSDESELNSAPAPSAERAAIRALRQHEHQRVRRLLEQLRNRRTTTGYTAEPLACLHAESSQPAPDAAASNLLADLHQRMEEVESGLDSVDYSAPHPSGQATPAETSGLTIDTGAWDIESPAIPLISEATADQNDSVGIDPELESELHRLRSAFDRFHEQSFANATSMTRPDYPTEPAEATASSPVSTPEALTTVSSETLVDANGPLASDDEQERLPAQEHEDPLSRIRASLASLLEDRPSFTAPEDSKAPALSAESTSTESYSETIPHASFPSDRGSTFASSVDPSPYSSVTEPSRVKPSSASTSMTGRHTEGSEGPEDEISIDSYMQQLLARLGGSSNTAESDTPSKPSPKQETSLSATISTSSQLDGKLQESISSQPGPRPVVNLVNATPRVAPERRDDLASLREVANETATWALDVSRRKRRVTSTIGWGSAALLAMTAGGLLLSAGSSIGAVSYTLGFASLGVAAFALLKAVRSNLRKS